MTVFEPTTPYRERLRAALHDGTGALTPLGEERLADWLIEREHVADPEWVAWLAEQVTQVKGISGRAEAAEATVARQNTEILRLQGILAKKPNDLENERDEARAAVAAGLALADDLDAKVAKALNPEADVVARTWAAVAADLKAALAGVTDPPWRHFRWFDAHPAVPREGTIHQTRRGTTEAACDECGEAIGLRPSVTDPRADVWDEAKAACRSDSKMHAPHWLNAPNPYRGDREATTHGDEEKP